MIFITGPLYSGKRTFANALPGTRIAEVQNLAKDADLSLIHISEPTRH